MAFRTPSVRVYQELLTVNPQLTTPFFELCIVGPCYQVETNVACGSYTLSDTDYTSAYVNQALGSVIDTDSVVVNLSNIYVKVWPQSASTLYSAVTVNNSGPITTLTATTNPFSESVIKAGDYIDITYKETGGDLTYSAVVQEVSSDGNTLTLKKNLPEPEESATITAVVKRVSPEDTMLESQYVTAKSDKFTIKTGASISTSVLDTAGVVVTADVAVAYRALRKDIANDFLTITSQSVAEAQLGKINVQNPLSVAASLVASAVSDMTYKVLPIDTDDKNGYLKALDILSTTEKVYVIIPLTDDKDVISSYASHCKTMSEPEKSRWRVMYANMPMPTTKVMIELNDGVLAKGGDDDHCYLKDTANGMFITNRARVTDFMDVYSDQNVYQYSLQLLEVLNDSVAEFSTLKWNRTSEGYVETEEKVTVSTNTNVRYEVVRVLDTQGVADAISGVAESFSNKRLRYVMPDSIMLNINSVDEMMPGYYLCVTLGAMRAGFPPHQGFSTMGLSGIKRVFKANKMFTDDQLAEMAGNGVFWVCQDEPEELPYVLYQTTTDTTQLETAEDSCVAVVDYASKFYKDNLKDVLGKYNVNTISLKYCTTVINSCSDQMMSTSYQYIGPILTAATLTSIEKKADKIIPTIKIEIPYPVNGVDVYLQV